MAYVVKAVGVVPSPKSTGYLGQGCYWKDLAIVLGQRSSICSVENHHRTLTFLQVWSSDSLDGVHGSYLALSCPASTHGKKFAKRRLSCRLLGRVLPLGLHAENPTEQGSQLEYSYVTGVRIMGPAKQTYS